MVYFGRHGGGGLRTKFSGNLVEVLPTGVFTDRDLQRSYTRKWDLQPAPSVPVRGCGVGCNTAAGGSVMATLRRVVNRLSP